MNPAAKGVVNVSLVKPPAEPPAEVPANGSGQAGNVVLMFERLATNPQVDVAKLEKLIAMQERILEHNAKAAFNAAFSEMQAEIPEIDERGQITVRGASQSTYAKNEDIQRVLRPILKKYGFSLSFRTEWPDQQTIKVVGILTHRDGHSRESEFLSAADDSGNKNAIQALGSAVSYGHRYTTKDLLNITSRGEDDDGASTARVGKPPAPGGYDDWLMNLEAVADNGTDRLKAMWNESKLPYRQYITANEPQVWAGLKAKAAQVRK